MEQTSVPIRSATRLTICTRSSPRVWARAMISLIISNVVSFSSSMVLSLYMEMASILYESVPVIYPPEGRQLTRLSGFT